MSCVVCSVVCVWRRSEPHFQIPPALSSKIAMPFSFLWALVPTLAVQFGGRENWATKPYAKVTVVARGPVAPELVRMHIEEVKLSIATMMGHHPNLEDSIDDVAVEIKRRMLVTDDEEASISTSVIMAMTAGATTVMY